MRKRTPKPAAGGTGSGSGKRPGHIHLANVECEIVKREGLDGYWVLVHPSGLDGFLKTELDYEVGQRISAIVSTTLPSEELILLVPAKEDS
jgi:hypothetical protein